MTRAQLAEHRAKTAENKARVDAISERNRARDRAGMAMTDDPNEALQSSGSIKPEVADRLHRLDMAKQEHAAHKAWRAKKAADPKCKDNEPATPNLDALRNQTKEEYSPMATKATKTIAPRAQKNVTPTGAHFYIDGEPVSDARNKLNEIAWNYTAGIMSKDSKRVPVREFRPMLEAMGVNVDEPGWNVTLKNGTTVELRKAPRGGESPKPEPAKASGPIKKAPVTKKAAATKATAKKQVTPIPKKRAAKKSAA